MRIVFTEHALEQMEKRKILKEEVIGAIKQPFVTKKKHGKYFYLLELERGAIEACCERTELNRNFWTFVPF